MTDADPKITPEEHTTYKQRLYQEYQRKYKLWGTYTGKYG